MTTTRYAPIHESTVQAFSFALDPTASQESSIRRHIGGRRYAYNWAVAEVRRELTLHHGAAYYSARQAWHGSGSGGTERSIAWRSTREALSGGIADAVTAYWNWQKNRSGIRSGVSVGFSRLRRKGGTRTVTGQRLGLSVSVVAGT